MGLVSQTLLVLRKDVLQEWRTRSRFAAVFGFGFVTLLLFSFASGADSNALRADAGGYLWLAMLLMSTLSLGESFRVEVQNHAMEGLLLLPTDPRAIYYGKAVGNVLVLALLGVLLVPLTIALYDLHVRMGVPTLVGVILLGTAGLCAPGTLYAALASRARGRDVMLPLLLFPLVVPAMLAAVRATCIVLEGDPMGQLGGWVGLLVAFDAIYWSLCGLLFGRVVED
jgi:heme exporter protein B